MKNFRVTNVSPRRFSPGQPNERLVIFKRIFIVGAIISAVIVGAVPATAATPGQDNARKKAKEYLEFQSFSRIGLIKQLKFEGFTKPQAIYGVNANHVNWNAQAVKKAKEYLENQSFSRSGLLAQMRFEGFTPAQAAYGVKKAYH